MVKHGYTLQSIHGNIWQDIWKCSLNNHSSYFLTTTCDGHQEHIKCNPKNIVYLITCNAYGIQSEREKEIKPGLFTFTDQ